MPDDQDTSTTRLSEGDDRNPEGIVHNLSSPFRSLQLAADELLEVICDIRMKAAQAISTATDYHWNAASDRLWTQLQQTRGYHQAVEREVAISGRAVQTVLQLAQATNRTMDFKMGYSGPWPSSDDKPMGFDEIEAGLAAISPDRRAELRTEIDSQVRLAATKITPRLRSTSEADIRDFVLELLAVGGEPRLHDKEVKALNDWLEYETDEIPTVRWEKRQIRQMLARLEPPPPPEPVQWTKPMKMKNLRGELGISHNTLKKRLIRGLVPEPGKYRYIGEGEHPRIIQVAIDDLPAKHQAKYRPQNPA